MKGKTQKGSKNLIVILIIACVLIIGLLSIVVILLLRDEPESANAEQEKRNVVVVNKDNVEEVIEQLVKEDEVKVNQAGSYTVCMDTEWYFASGDVASRNARVDNLIENTHDVYFDIFLADNEEEPIYCSPVIPRGAFLEQIVLDKKLDAGTYDCVMVYHLVDEEQETVSTLRLAFKIIVES